MTSAAPTVAATPAAPHRAAGRFGRIASSVLVLVAMMALIAVAVAGVNGIRVRVEQTGSMAPALHPGDLVLVRDTPIAQVRVGDVIGVREPDGRVIVHRVVRIDGAGGFLRVHTKGDANPTGEDWSIPRASSVALVQGSVPVLGRVVDAARGPVAAGIVALAGLLLALSALKSVWRRPS